MKLNSKSNSFNPLPRGGGLGWGYVWIVIGTALPIMMTMVVCLVLYIRFAPLYPEQNRDKMMVVSRMACSWAMAQVSPNVARMADALPHADAVACVAMNDQRRLSKGQDSKERIKVKQAVTNGGFWRVFGFDFICGQPYTDQQMEADERVMVMTDQTAQRLFATTDVVGRHVWLNCEDYRIVGVVRSASPLMISSYAEVYTPYHHADWHLEPRTMNGESKVYILPKDNDAEALRAELADEVARYNADLEEWKHLTLFDQPDEYWKSQFRSFDECDYMKYVRFLMLALAAILLIPALNMCGMIASHVDRRRDEIFVRRTYGATRSAIIWQMLVENMRPCFIGGVLGLVLSYVLLYTNANWLVWSFMGIASSGDNVFSGTDVQLHMIFNPVILLATFMFCIIVNAISTIIPVWLALKRSFVTR